jgi:hypothetical protein
MPIPFPLAASLILFSASCQNLLENPGFEEGLSGWQTNAPQRNMGIAEVEGNTVARIEVTGEDRVAYPYLFQEIDVNPGDILRARVEVTGEEIRDGFGAYAAIEYYGGEEGRLSYTQTPESQRGTTRKRLDIKSVVPTKALRARLCLLLNGRGEAFFDNAVLTREPGIEEEIEGPVTLSVTDRIVSRIPIGFGAEDDGWFYNEENAAHGIDEEDIALREARIEWMDPDWVRMFFWHADWCPSGDWKTFTFDSPNMKSHYRTLDLYRRIGARVNVVGVEWGKEDPYGNPGQFAQALGELFEHLIKTKGYTCIQDWTLTNEPNTDFCRRGYSFERFVEIHQLVREEFSRRGLDIKVVGSDDTSGFQWFRDCVENDAYFELADLFASHRYLPFTDLVFIPDFIDDRLSTLRARNPVKPLVLAEFGFQDNRSGTLVNPLMESYPYALWTAAFVLEGLNRGVAGFSIWCLHEVYYPGNGFMNYGLWDFKDNDWRPRPVYHAWAQFSRLTEPGDPAIECESSHPSQIKGAVVDKTLFWVNLSDRSLDIRVTGLDVTRVRVHTQETLHGDRECGTLGEAREGRFSAPPRSFGTAY